MYNVVVVQLLDRQICEVCGNMVGRRWMRRWWDNSLCPWVNCKPMLEYILPFLRGVSTLTKDIDIWVI